MLVSPVVNAQTPANQLPTGPSSVLDNSLEYSNGPTAKIDIEELKDIKVYALNANTSIIRILTALASLEDQTNFNVVAAKKMLMDNINVLIAESKDQRSILLLTHALQSGMTMVKLIEKTVQEGTSQTPAGTINKQFYILKQSLIFAKEYYQSDFKFIDGVLTTQEIKANPKFVEFGVKLTKFLIEMSNGVVNTRDSYGMIRWSLAVLANYIKNDKNQGVAFASTRYNLVTELTTKDENGSPLYPDLVNGEEAPDSTDCITKTRELKRLAQESFKEIENEQNNLNKN